ncbi:MAG: T9SS type A sorting domain-containing protein [Gelidibacter sp.]
MILNISLGFSQTAPTIEWQNTIGGSEQDNFTELRIVNDGYIIGGYSRSDISGDKTENSNGVFDYWILKLNNAGNIEWQNTIGGESDEDTFTLSTTSDGGYIIGGHSESQISGDKTEVSNNGDFWVLKLDNTGNIEWQNTIGGSNGDELNSISQTSDGGYILGGTSNSPISFDKTEASLGLRDYWVVKLDSTGNIEWQNTIGGNNVDILSSIKETNDNGFIISGQSNSGISGDKTEDSVGVDYWIIKLNSIGNIEWQNTISGDLDDYLVTTINTNDNGFILGGYSNSNISGDKTENSNGGYDYWVIKLNSIGNIEWQNTIGGNNDEALTSLIQTNDGKYVLGGYSNSNISGDKTEDSKGDFDYWLVKIDETGNLIWQKTIGGNGSDGIYSIQQTDDNGFILGGLSNSSISGNKTENSNGGIDYWVLKLSPETLSINDNFTKNITIYPNPTNDILNIIYEANIKYEIINQLGEKVISSQEKVVDLNSLKSGIYYIKVTDEKDKLLITKKIIKD